VVTDSIGSGRSTRRQLLQTGAALGAGAAAAVPLLSLGTNAVAAANRCRGKLDDIEHFVILMQENRSFDQYFGTFPGAIGFDDSKNRQAFRQPGYTGTGSVNGELLPFQFDGSQPVGQCVSDPTHDWPPQHESRNGGRNNQFYSSHAPAQYDGPAAPGVMGYYRKSDIPLHWRLAKAYTLCDRYFCSVLGPTQPNRCYAISAWLGQDGQNGGPSLHTNFDGSGFVGEFSWETMPERLSDKGVSWKSYTQAFGQFDNVFTCFSRFKNDPALNALGIKPVYPDDFVADLDSGNLPQVSFIQLSFAQSEHAAYPPAAGEFGISGVLNAIWGNKKTWRKTAVIINYDENGGFFDHVAPPVPKEGTAGEYLSMAELPADAGGIRGPVGLGYRVPCIVVSPWSKGGLITSKTFDHTSVLRLLETRYNVDVPNLTKWRRKNTNDLVEAFDFASKPDFSVPALPPTSITSPLVTTEECAETAPPPYPVPASTAIPRQDKLRRKVKRPSGPC
jgi:phospholipase C